MADRIPSVDSLTGRFSTVVREQLAAEVADPTTEIGVALKSAMDSATAGYSRKAVLPINVHDYGAVDDGVTDNTAAFRAAITAALSAGRSVIAPGKVYSFTPTGSGIILPLTTGITLSGGGKGTTFKIKSGASVDWKAFIGSNAFTTDDLTGLTLRNFTFDYNTQGNPVTDATHLSSNVRAMVMVPKGARISVTDIDVLNGDGVWVCQLGATSADVAANYRVSDSLVDINVFNFGVNSVYHDASAVYFVGDRNKVRGSYLGASSAPAAICAVEIHGSLNDVSVKVDGFVSICNLTGEDIGISSSIVVHDCVGRNLMNGINLWSINTLGATTYGLDGVTVTNNDIELNPGYWSSTGQPSPPGNFNHTGVGISDRGAAVNLPIANLTIKGNSIRYVSSGSGVAQKIIDAGITLVRAAAITSVSLADKNIDISDNNIVNPISAGIVVSLNNTAENIRVDNNRVRNPASLGTATIGTAYATGAYLAGTFKLLSVDGMEVYDDRGTTIVTSAVNFSAVLGSNVNVRLSCLDPVVYAVTAPMVVVGPAGGGVFTRYAAYGYTPPTGKCAYGSYITDYLGGARYMQTAVPSGSTWTLQP